MPYFLLPVMLTQPTLDRQDSERGLAEIISGKGLSQSGKVHESLQVWMELTGMGVSANPTHWRNYTNGVHVAEHPTNLTCGRKNGA